MKHMTNPIRIRPIDFIPALSGLIGKTALVTSFAVVWSQQLNINTPDFVFENVRIELIIAGIITIIIALLQPNTAPSGTLAPLIVLVPAMADFGVHPFILSILTGLLGILSIRTGLFQRLISLSGYISKTSITLTFGISGAFMAFKNLSSFFGDERLVFLLITLFLVLIYALLIKYNKNWLMIPTSAIVALIIPFLIEADLVLSATISLPNFNPYYWWNTMWSIGFGLDLLTTLKTLPFACFIIILWAVDTLSVQTVIESVYKAGEPREELPINRSFVVSSIRNIIGGSLGGAQTSALWRSFLIPLFMIKRPIQPSALLLGVMAVAAGILSIPVKLLSYPPLIWYVLLFGIFLPFILVGIKNIRTKGKPLYILCLTLAGIMISPIVTWIGAVLCDRFIAKSQIN